ncbi:unnamed protein product [Linum trigynum]
MERWMRLRSSYNITLTVPLIIILHMITHTTQQLTFMYICNKEKFDDGDLRLPCAYSLLEILSLYRIEGGMPGKQECAGPDSGVYGYVWVDVTRRDADITDYVSLAEAVLKNNCPNRKGAQVNETTGICRVRYELYSFTIAGTTT